MKWAHPEDASVDLLLADALLGQRRIAADDREVVWEGLDIVALTLIVDMENANFNGDRDVLLDYFPRQQSCGASRTGGTNHSRG